ncbi:tRNA (adenosine(37)-N6)-dimethylallyltransferase MiaA [bacterium]|nr:tRNA (adenosine(37)-N6)-dimethylallyltransferase MiaA [bacterium]
MSKNSLLAFVVGPTASGKSKMALELAEEFNSELVNCDSIQVYKEIDIGSAKPSKDELERVPHHLYSFVDLKDSYTVSDYYSEAQKTIEDLELKKKNPIFFVGGSGFYFQALEHGMFEIDPISAEVKNQVREDLESHGVNFLHQKLKEVDQQTASNISENDTYRVTRAMEVFLATGKTMSQHKNEFEKDSSLKEKREILKIGLNIDRDRLREIVKARTDKMLENGLLEEVKDLVDRGFESSFALSSVGYKEVVQFLKGGLTREEMLYEINKNTMRLAKRQMTWFRRDTQIHWIDANKDFFESFKEVKDLINQKLS